jgi:S-methylmethionine-dependent homocysteine/selenocysteine methylase
VNDPITILDGGMSRELMRLGAPFRQPEWSALALMEAPDYVAQVHREFIAAGAEVITTDSYALVPFHIGQERFVTDGERLARRAGEVARQAVEESGRPTRVAGSLPPLFGSYRPDLFDAARAADLLTPLVDGLRPSVDLWLAETLSSTAEARTVREVLGDDPRPLWVSFTLDDTGDVEAIVQGDVAPTLRSGESIAVAVSCAREIGAGTLLFNCTQAEMMAAAIAAARQIDPDLPLGAYANAFVPSRKEGAANEGLSDVRADLDPESYARIASTWVDAGATVIGGCCGIGCAHIAHLSQSLSSS